MTGSRPTGENRDDSSGSERARRVAGRPHRVRGLPGAPVRALEADLRLRGVLPRSGGSARAAHASGASQPGGAGSLRGRSPVSGYPATGTSTASDGGSTGSRAGTTLGRQAGASTQPRPVYPPPPPPPRTRAGGLSVPCGRAAGQSHGSLAAQARPGDWLSGVLRAMSAMTARLGAGEAKAVRWLRQAFIRVRRNRPCGAAPATRPPRASSSRRGGPVAALRAGTGIALLALAGLAGLAVPETTHAAEVTLVSNLDKGTERSTILSA